MRLTGYCHVWLLDVFRVGFIPYCAVHLQLRPWLISYTNVQLYSCQVTLFQGIDFILHLDPFSEKLKTSTLTSWVNKQVPIIPAALQGLHCCPDCLLLLQDPCRDPSLQDPCIVCRMLLLLTPILSLLGSGKATFGIFQPATVQVDTPAWLKK